MTEHSEEQIQAWADEWGWEPQGVAFALGYTDGNVADAKAFLADMADEMDSEDAR